MRKWRVICLMFLSASPSFANETYEETFSCASKSKDFIQSYRISDEDNSVSFTLCSGEKIVPEIKEKEEVGGLHISPDRRWIGWTVETENCCTSYKVATWLNIHHAGKFYTIKSDGQMIWNWQFSDEVGKVLLEQGTVHGMSEPNIDEYDIKTGKKIRHIKDGK